MNSRIEFIFVGLYIPVPVVVHIYIVHVIYTTINCYSDEELILLY